MVSGCGIIALLPSFGLVLKVVFLQFGLLFGFFGFVFGPLLGPVLSDLGLGSLLQPPSAGLVSLALLFDLTVLTLGSDQILLQVISGVFRGLDTFHAVLGGVITQNRKTVLLVLVVFLLHVFLTGFPGGENHLRVDGALDPVRKFSSTGSITLGISLVLTLNLRSGAEGKLVLDLELELPTVSSGLDLPVKTEVGNLLPNILLVIEVLLDICLSLSVLLGPNG